MNLIQTFDKLNRSSQKKVIETLLVFARQINSNSYNDLMSMLNYYECMDDFSKHRLKFNQLSSEEIQGLIILARKNISDIQKKGILMESEKDFVEKIKKCQFTSIDDEITSIVNQTIIHLKNRKNRCRKNTISLQDTYETLEASRLVSNSFLDYYLLEFCSTYQDYVTIIPDSEEVIIALQELDAYIKIHADFYTLDAYNSLSLEEKLYLLGKLLTYTKEDFKKAYADKFHVNSSKETHHERKRNKTKYPKLKERKKYNYILR